MGLFSWCTSDTKKSIAVDMRGYEGAPKKVYLLNPFGPAYEETNYEGYGEFGGEDVYALVAKWNVPEKCKSENGAWLPTDEIRLIGIDLACYEEDHVKLQYPIKIVENLTTYENASISPTCPFQGYFYPDDIKEINNDVSAAFWDLDDATRAYLKYLECEGKEELILSILDLESSKEFDKFFRKITAKDPNAPESVLLEIAVNGDIYIKQDLVNNPNLSMQVLNELEKKKNNEYIHRRIKMHPNYCNSSLDEKIINSENKLKTDHSVSVEKSSKDMSRE